jgi:hypothetical protein
MNFTSALLELRLRVVGGRVEGKGPEKPRAALDHQHQRRLGGGPFEEEAVGYVHATGQGQRLEVNALDLEARRTDRRHDGIDHVAPGGHEVDGVAGLVADRVPREVDVGRLHRDLAATFELHGTTELVGGQPW